MEIRCPTHDAQSEAEPKAPTVHPSVRTLVADPRFLAVHAATWTMVQCSHWPLDQLRVLPAFQLIRQLTGRASYRITYIIRKFLSSVYARRNTPTSIIGTRWRTIQELFRKQITSIGHRAALNGFHPQQVSAFCLGDYIYRTNCIVMTGDHNPDLPHIDEFRMYHIPLRC